MGLDMLQHVKTTMRTLSTWGSGILLLLLLSGCQDSSMSDLREWVASAYKDEKPEIEPLPEIPPYKSYEYKAADQDDPFDAKNIITDRPEATVAGDSPNKNRRKEELERYPLDALKMVGTLIQEEKPYVIVQTSEGTAHRATVGNYMGQNEGQIKQILPLEQKVVLAELVLDPGGRWVTREVEFTIDE